MGSDQGSDQGSDRGRAARKAALAVLGLTEDATRADVTAAFRHLVRSHHPDTAGTTPESSTRFTAICDAYHLLTGRDPVEDGGAPSQASRPSDAEPVPRPRPTGSPSPPAPNVVTDAMPWLVAGPVRVEPTDADGGRSTP